MKLDPNTLLAEFLERLSNKSSEQLFAEIEQALEDSKDSWILDEEQGK